MTLPEIAIAYIGQNPSYWEEIEQHLEDKLSSYQVKFFTDGRALGQSLFSVLTDLINFRPNFIFFDISGQENPMLEMIKWLQQDSEFSSCQHCALIDSRVSVKARDDLQLAGSGPIFFKESTPEELVQLAMPLLDREGICAPEIKFIPLQEFIEVAQSLTLTSVTEKYFRIEGDFFLQPEEIVQIESYAWEKAFPSQLFRVLVSGQRNIKGPYSSVGHFAPLLIDPLPEQQQKQTQGNEKEGRTEQEEREKWEKEMELLLPRYKEWILQESTVSRNHFRVKCLFIDPARNYYRKLPRSPQNPTFEVVLESDFTRASTTLLKELPNLIFFDKDQAGEDWENLACLVAAINEIKYYRPRVVVMSGGETDGESLQFRFYYSNIFIEPAPLNFQSVAQRVQALIAERKEQSQALEFDSQQKILIDPNDRQRREVLLRKEVTLHFISQRVFLVSSKGPMVLGSRISGVLSHLKFSLYLIRCHEHDHQLFPGRPFLYRGIVHYARKKDTEALSQFIDALLHGQGA